MCGSVLARWLHATRPEQVGDRGHEENIYRCTCNWKTELSQRPLPAQPDRGMRVSLMFVVQHRALAQGWKKSEALRPLLGPALTVEALPRLAALLLEEVSRRWRRPEGRMLPEPRKRRRSGSCGTLETPCRDASDGHAR